MYGNKEWAPILSWLETNAEALGWIGGLSLLSFVATLIAVPLLIVALPTRYLVNDGDDDFFRKTIWRIPYLIVKNVLGALLVLAGLAMLLLPGQGLLTLLIGMTLVNFPGKRGLVRRLLKRRRVVNAVNRLRHLFNRPPLEMRDD